MNRFLHPLKKSQRKSRKKKKYLSNRLDRRMQDLR
jgi:hypothetical protein